MIEKFRNIFNKNDKSSTPRNRIDEIFANGKFLAGAKKMTDKLYEYDAKRG